MLTDNQRERFEAWVKSVGPRAVAFARSLVRDQSRADDVVQECLFRILRNAEKYDIEKDGVKLLFKAISNLCINQATREKHILSLQIGGENGRQLPSDPAALRPEQILQHRELEAAVRDGLQGLPPLQRAAVELRALGMSKEEIGEALGVTATNAGVLVHRGRQALAVTLEPFLATETE
jgi:RNA polymerase sigma-70 factor (ECF subfamily)